MRALVTWTPIVPSDAPIKALTIAPTITLVGSVRSVANEKPPERETKPKFKVNPLIPKAIVPALMVSKVKGIPPTLSVAAAKLEVVELYCTRTVPTV